MICRMVAHSIEWMVVNIQCLTADEAVIYSETRLDLGFTQGCCARVQLPCYIEDFQLGSVF